MPQLPGQSPYCITVASGASCEISQFGYESLADAQAFFAELARDPATINASLNGPLDESLAEYDRHAKVPTCEIKWIVNGCETGDDNPSIGRIRTRDRVSQIGGRGVHFNASQWFHVCAEHAKRLSDPGMHIWECESPLREG